MHDLALEVVNEKIKLLNAQASIERDTLIKDTRQAMNEFRDSGDIYLGGTAMRAQI